MTFRGEEVKCGVRGEARSEAAAGRAIREAERKNTIVKFWKDKKKGLLLLLMEKRVVGGSSYMYLLQKRQAFIIAC